MQLKLLDILACPRCHGALACHPVETAPDGDLLTATLRCATCSRQYGVSNGIPRFVEAASYADSFGYQWNQFKLEQLDSANGTRLSEQRFYGETGWTTEWMAGKWLLEAGCGAGRFLEVASRSNANVVGIDLSNSVDAARQSLGRRKNVHLVQASIYQLPFRPGVFDGCYSIGVLQHTPDRHACIAPLARVLRPEARLAITVYERRRGTMLNGKYWLRPITRRLPKRLLLWLLKLAMPIVFPICELLFRLPLAGRFFRFVIPVADYVEKPELSLRERYRWAVLDTFDMLSPAFDAPMTEAELRSWLGEAGIANTRRLPSGGLTLVGERSASAAARAEV